MKAGGQVLQGESEVGERYAVSEESGFHLWVLEIGEPTQNFFYLHNSSHEHRVAKERGPIGHPRRTKPSLTMGMSGGKGLELKVLDLEI